LKPGDPPRGEEVGVDVERCEIRFLARVQQPRNKPRFDDFGRRIQAFVACGRADGHPSQFSDHFVFLADADTETIYNDLIELGLESKVHFSRAEGRQRTGRDFLQGDRVEMFISWQEGGRWVERPYQDLVQEKVVEDGKEVVRPRKPSFVFHGSGAIHKEATGCIACPCDCPGGLIADNRFPIYEPKPIVKFDWFKAPPEGTTVVVRIRPSRSEGAR
jgi:hypothetical protein